MAGTCALCEHREDSTPTFCYWGFPIGLAAQISRHPQWAIVNDQLWLAPAMIPCCFHATTTYPTFCNTAMTAMPLLELRVMSLLILVCKKYIQPTFRSLPDTFKYFMSHIIAKTWPSALNSPIIGEHREKEKYRLCRMTMTQLFHLRNFTCTGTCRNSVDPSNNLPML
jgi:hypothetical protein